MALSPSILARFRRAALLARDGADAAAPLFTEDASEKVSSPDQGTLGYPSRTYGSEMDDDPVGYHSMKWVSAGGVVVPSLHVDEIEYVYIRKPTGNYGGKEWTLPKGRVDDGETREKTAIREVEEEIGIRAQILANGYLGKYSGSMSDTHYYLMVRTGGSPASMDGETEQVRLVSFDTAIKMFTEAGNRRDAQVIEAARKVTASIREKNKGKRHTRRMVFQRVKVSAADYAKEQGIEVRDYIDSETKRQDRSRVVLRVSRWKPVSVLDSFLDAARLRPELKATGSAYHLAVVSAKDFAGSHIAKETAAIGKRW